MTSCLKSINQLSRSCLKKQAEKLKSHKMKDGWMIKDEGWMMKNDDFKLLRGEGFCRQTDGQTDKQTFVIVESLLQLKTEVRTPFENLVSFTNEKSVWSILGSYWSRITKPFNLQENDGFLGCAKLVPTFLQNHIFGIFAVKRKMFSSSLNPKI